MQNPAGQGPVVATVPPPVARDPVRLSPVQAFGLSFVFILVLGVVGLLDTVQRHPTLLWSILGCTAILLAWGVALAVLAQRERRVFTLDVVLQTQHYIQACAQGTLLLYWGWHWQEVYASAYLIAAQLACAYAFDMLLCWSRRGTWVLGFGPFPVIFSINLFLWFKPDWFYLQFLMIALGFAAKQLIRWNRDGRRVHIFNPSSLPLAVFSLALILTGATDLTWARDIASTQFYPPQIYLVVFLVALPGQFLFGVAAMTMSAVVVTYLFGLAYFAATGTYYFLDSNIPIAVFIGMHLLFTDPSTSPRTELGRLVFGAVYGSSTVALLALLGYVGAPTVYDKLLQVPLMNLSVRLIDRVTRSRTVRAFDPAALGRTLRPRQRNLAYMAVWVIVFAAMSITRGLGDHHPGQMLTFWLQACTDDRPYACDYSTTLLSTFCRGGSGWACNELGILEAKIWDEPRKAAAAFKDGCARGLRPACLNATTNIRSTAAFATAPPALADYPIILQEGKGPITDVTPSALFARACRQGWRDTCGRADP